MDQKTGFYVSKSSRRATILLIALIFIIIFLPRIVTYLNPMPDLVVTSEMISEAEEIQHRKKSRYEQQFVRKKNKRSKYKIPPEKFDPNHYTKNDWMALGLSEKQAAVVMKFTERGIRSSEDLQRIFVMPDQLFDLVKDSLIFNEARDNEINSKAELPKQVKAVLIELNSANKEQLMSLPGIGDYISDRIISYRDRLGGFVKKEQLMEIKKIDIELYNKIVGQVTIESGSVKRIPLNSISAEEIKKHPYLNWNIANSIVKIREQKGGKFSDTNEIKESVLIDHELFEKIKPYLSL